MAELFTIYPNSPNIKLLHKAAEALNAGALMIYPTDTVYAMGCLSNHPAALEKFARLKNIKLIHAPLSFLFDDLSALSHYVAPIDSATFKILKRCLPGPFAFIMQAARKLPKPFQKRKTIGVRISNHPILKQLLPLLNAPLITSSLHDEDSILDYTTDPSLIFEQWQDKIDLMIDAGFGDNIPSTVVDLTVHPFEILRTGKGDVHLL